MNHLVMLNNDYKQNLVLLIENLKNIDFRYLMVVKSYHDVMIIWEELM
jgi:hypothetical protein